MTAERVFLNTAGEASRKLVDAVADWLLEGWPAEGGHAAERVRVTPEGCPSLAHVMVVVPTAQAGRNLRLAIARRFPDRGVLPPRVILPMQLVRPAEETLREATSVEAASAFQQYVKTHRSDVLKLDRIVWPEAFADLTARFALFDQLEDIWRALAGRGLLMCDVLTLGMSVLEAGLGDEVERWRQLARLEADYFGYLHAHGACYPTERVRAAKARAAIVDAAIEEIVLPALADPVRILGDILRQQLAAGKRVTVLLHATESEAGRFDEWGWPKTEAWTGRERPNLDRLADGDLVCAANASELARIAAADCPEAAEKRELPSLVLCDGELQQGVASAFLNRGYVLHDPERHRLVQSSLGRLVKDLIALYPEGDLPWRECLSVLRSSDVQGALGLDDARRESVLKGADVAQNAFLPTAIPKGFAFPSESGIRSWQQKDFAAFCEVGRALEAHLAAAREGSSLGAFLRRMLRTVFAAHRTGGRADEKEFLAAAEGTGHFLASLESEFVASLNPSNAEFEALARRALEAVAYSLEPDVTDAVKTEGWLELPWTTGRTVSLIGLHEGKVPDAIVGHPFLPDSLRAALGLVTNADRLARDTWILKELLDSHEPHAVRAYVARTGGDGDICRPSRLLYLCGEAALPGRIRALFGDLPVARTDKTRRIEWPLALRDDVPMPDHFSASALDAYVTCPFTYFLKYALRMNVYREKRELEANDFGTYVHDVLQRYARSQIARGDDQLTDAAEIRRVILGEIAPASRARFVKPTLNIELQLKAAEGRLALFAERQAEWARAGWRIREAECDIDDVVPELGVRIRGSIDRVDENIRADAEKGWCLIDYKTWDAKEKFNAHVLTSPRAHQATKDRHFGFAARLGFPLVENDRKQPAQRVLSVQLPVYGKCYAAKRPEVPFADMRFVYFVLGKSADEVGPCEPLTDRQVAVSIANAKRAIELIGGSVFWPPGPTDAWRWDYANLFAVDPRTDLGGSDWARRQEEKLEAHRV